MARQMLWIIDIDGTLVNVHSNQVPAWNKALAETYGFVPDAKTLVSYFGKPFRSVVWSVAGHYGVADERIRGGYSTAFKVYTTEVCANLDEMGGEVLPGAIEFLEYLGSLGMKRAIATGNPREEAEYKLKYFDLLKYFDILVYCEERRERIEMVEEAVKQAQEKYDMDLKSNPKRVVIVGDSIHDVESARQIGGTSVALRTGPMQKELLVKAHPDFIIDELKDCKKLVNEVVSFVE